jgi:hypothetical protein
LASNDLSDIFPWLSAGSVFGLDGKYYIIQAVLSGKDQRPYYLISKLGALTALYFLGGLLNGNRDHGNQYDRKNQADGSSYSV